MRLLERGTRLGLLLLVSVASIVVLCVVPRVPLGQGYHDFADKRAMLGVPNCLDVLSNIPFILAGCWGVVWLFSGASKGSFVLAKERIPYFVFFAGVALTGFGSFWYHLSPGNSRLPWDLLPMTLSFMSMLVAVIMERIGVKVGFWLYGPLLILGVSSVAYWYFTEAQGRGDYRFYLFVQFFPPVLLAMIVTLFPRRYTATTYLFGAFLLFVAAKLFEVFDKQIYSFTGIVSGHSLKHLTAGIACYWILRMLQRRRAVGAGADSAFLWPSGVGLEGGDRQPVRSI